MGFQVMMLRDEADTEVEVTGCLSVLMDNIYFNDVQCHIFDWLAIGAFNLDCFQPNKICQLKKHSSP